MKNNKRTKCPRCDEETEFVQLGGAESSTTVTDPETVGEGLLELRVCNNCPRQVENILRVNEQNVSGNNA